MSAEVGVVFALPAVAAVGLTVGAGFLLARGVGALAGAAGDRLAERQSRGWAAADRLARAVGEYSILQDQIERGRAEFGDRITAAPVLGEAPSVGAHLDRAEAWAGQVSEILAAADARFRRELAAARAGRIMADVAAVLDRLPKPTPTPGRPQQAATPAPSRQVAESLERVLSRMDGGVPPELAATLQRRAADALKARTETNQLRLLDDLRYSVDQANQDVRRRRTALTELAGRLAGFTGPAVEEAQAMILAAAADPDPDLDGLAQAVEAAITATLAPMVRDYTRQALRDALEEVGCAVEEGFDVALGRDGLAHLHRDGWDDLAVRVRSRPGPENAYYFNMVAPADAHDSDVAEVEQQWCSAVDRLVPALAAHGVRVTTTHRSEEGEAQVQPVDPARFPFERRRRDDRRRSDLQRRERELPR
ncbi:hypothetical protein ODJ79_40580 [Actinoplanes sp. KI2]|uniref:hypothetical protein n=1 Tax=Actinoplanes sp. KI2 TaxID=2983315 RepID=UPI0021D57DDC|nr:hypothetical protein [Actinoplanes sp. KI2]MCU7730049.1 hypothetical protein [Actinoplanes sp. KI2]